jgi:hypothetical protein
MRGVKLKVVAKQAGGGCESSHNHRSNNNILCKGSKAAVIIDDVAEDTKAAVTFTLWTRALSSPKRQIGMTAQLYPFDFNKDVLQSILLEQ